MKRLVFLILMMVVTVAAISQKSIKGYELGEKYKTDDHKETTVFGRKATVVPLLLNDGRAFSVIASFEDNERSDMLYLKDKIESVFDVYLIKVDVIDNESYVDIYRYEATKNGVKYILFIEEDTLYKKYIIMMGIVDKNLEKIHNKEIENDI